MDDIEALLEARKAKLKGKKRKWVRKGDKRREQEEKRAAKKRKIFLKKDVEKKKEKEVEKKEEKQAEVDIDPHKVKMRLRELDEPIQLFGEADQARLERLRKVELKYEERKQTASGNINVKHQIMREVNKELELALAKGLDNLETEKKETKHSKYDKPRKRSECKSSEEYILCFYKRMLREWAQSNKDMPDDQRRSMQGKKKAGLQGLARRDMKPLLKLLKNKTCQPDIVKKLSKLVDCCFERNYVRAKQWYFQLAIGNAPWPVGVTAPGIHERAGKTKIEETEVAHVLNDETQRKYIHGIDRCTKFCQTKYPAYDSSLNFNPEQDKLNKLIVKPL